MKESVASSAIILNWFNDVAKCCEANVQAARKVAGTASITVIDLGFLAAPNQNTRIKKGFRPMVSQGSLDSKAPHLLASWHESCSVGFASLLLPARFSKCLLPACQLVLYFEVCGICFYYSLWNLFIESQAQACEGLEDIGRKSASEISQDRPKQTNVAPREPWSRPWQHPKVETSATWFHPPQAPATTSKALKGKLFR